MRETISFADEWSVYRASTANGAWEATLAEDALTIAATSLSPAQSDDSGNPLLVEWESLRDATDLDVTVRVRCTDSGTFHERGVTMWARLPTPPFTPTSGPCYALQRQAQRLFFHVGHAQWSPTRIAEVNLGASMVVDAWYFMRFQVSELEAGSRLRGKMWAAGDIEPDWQTTHTLEASDALYVTPGGRFGVSNGGNGNSSASPLWKYEWDEAVDLLSGGNISRVRSHVSEDAGSLFQATQAVAVESAVSEAFPYGSGLASGALTSFREALTPGDVALRYYAIPTRNQEMLATVEGETKLGRMASVYPSAIMQRVTDISDLTGDSATAQDAIQYIFDQWAAEFAWLTFEDVPDLRFLVPEAVAAPRQHYIDNPEAGVVTVEAITIPQDDENRRSMRDIVDEWLAIFAGTVIRQNSSGNVELVPRVGPDAPEASAVELTWRDLKSMSDGEDDPRGVYNRATSKSQAWEWQENQAVLPPLYVIGTRSDGLAEAELGDVLPVDEEPLVNGGTREFSKFVEPETDIELSVTFRAYSESLQSGASNLTQEADVDVTIALGPNESKTHTFSWFIFDVDNEQTDVTFTRTPTGLRVRISHSGRYVFGPNPFVGIRYVAYLVSVTAATGTAWTRSNVEVTGTFGYDSSDFLPDADDPTDNALTTSVAAYGEREAIIRSDVFQLTPEQAQAVARAYVLTNISPRTIRDVQQSEWNKYPVKFDHIGLLVDLPNGETAVVEDRSYTDSFQPGGGLMESTFTATVRDEWLDTSVTYLYLDDGDFMQLDDGSIAEEQ